MEIIIVPIIKNQKALITDKDNYMPITINSVVSMIWELLLLIRLQFQLEMSSNQYGFKSKHGTDMCVYTLGQITEYYNPRSSLVYICYLDASKACDRWYCQQTFCDGWGNQFSQFFTVSNGVR